ncbi:MAG: hypothetical protein IKU23_04780 [Clostridia bacterium]|nr:hypothetical protein [Clostridia bacterium]MBR5278564.1 hypothetical protein [Clostridia bacterium]
MERAKKKAPKVNQRSIWLNGLISGGIGLLVIVALLLILPAMLISSADPKAYITPLVVFCVGMGGAAAGAIAASVTKGNELVAALIAAAVVVLPLIGISLLINGGFNFFGFLTVVITVFLMALAGGYAVTKISGGRKRSMKKIMKRR